MRNKKLVLSMTGLALTAASSLAYATEKANQEKILMVVANTTIAPTVGWSVGFWASELTHPYHELEQAGYKIEIASIEGGKVNVDAYSDPRHESKYSAHDFVSLGFLESPVHQDMLNNTQPLASLNINDYEAIIIAGGQSPMFTFRGNPVLEKTIKEFYQAGKPTAALCHGVAALIDIKDESGKYLIDGKTITGFSSEEDGYVDKVLNTKLFNWWIEPEAIKHGASFSKSGMWQPHAVADGNLITGQQQNSGPLVARLVIEQLKEGK